MPADQISWGRTIISYDWRLAARATLAISVHPDLSVTVAAPLGTSVSRIRERVHARAAWIFRTKREFALYLPALPARRYVGGESHRYLGRLYRLRIEPHRVPDVRAARGLLVVRVPKGTSRPGVRSLVEDWYRTRARAVLTARLDKLLPMVPFDRGPAYVRIRRLSRRWGSCSKGGVITLNEELILAPIDCIDYVIAHELCHLHEHNHGTRFWSLLRRVIPDWRARRERLNRLGIS